MNESQAYEILLALINARHAAIIASADSFLNVLAKEDLGTKRNKAADLGNKIKMLSPLLVQNEIPQWMIEFVADLDQYAAGSLDGSTMLTRLVHVIGEIRNQQWDSVGFDRESINFEAIFEEYRKTSRLPELLDEIVVILEQIHESEEVDSKAMLTSLERVMTTLKTAKKGTYFSLGGAWGFLLTFLENYLWAELEKLPGLGSAATALRKTVETMNDELVQMSSAMTKEFNNKVATLIKGAPSASNVGFLSYDNKGILFQNPKPQSSASTVV